MNERIHVQQIISWKGHVSLMQPKHMTVSDHLLTCNPRTKPSHETNDDYDLIIAVLNMPPL